MKKTILGFTVILLMCISGMGISLVRAYTVTVQKDGIYGEKIPDTVIDNAPALFQKSVKKALKYDQKYKDADAVTRANKIEYPYDKFLDIAKKIKERRRTCRILFPGTAEWGKAVLFQS